MIINLNNLEKNQDLKCDICIVGGGAAGSILFDQLSKAKLNTILLESGLENLNENYQNLNTGDVLLQGKSNSNKDTVVDLKNWRLRGLGGTTGHWGGGCSKFYEIDFTKRNWVKFSGWPISRNDLNPYYKKAHSYFDISSEIFDERVWDNLDVKSNLLNLNYNKIKTMFSHRSGFLKKSLNMAVREYTPVNFKKYLVNSNSVNKKNKIIYNATLTELVSNDNKHIDHGKVKSLEGTMIKIYSKKFILCTGGYEVPRILLNSGIGNGLGNDNDLVGRFFLGHITSYDFIELICNSKEIASKLAWNFNWHKVEKNNSKVHIGFNDNIQKENSLLNTGIWIIGKDDEDSAVYKVKQIRRELKSKNFKNINLSSKELLFILKNIDEVLINIKHGYFNPRGVKNPTLQSLTLGYMAEQEPNKSSRIYLSNKKDGLGMKKIIFDWHLSELDKKNPMKIAKLLASIFGEANVGKIILNKNLEDRINNFKGFHSGLHPSGTTRMSENKNDGVVDKNLKSHFVNNLYVCSSAVFPTSSYHNPTYTIGALAVRLAEHLIES